MGNGNENGNGIRIGSEEEKWSEMNWSERGK